MRTSTTCRRLRAAPALLAVPAFLCWSACGGSTASSSDAGAETGSSGSSSGGSGSSGGRDSGSSSGSDTESGSGTDTGADSGSGSSGGADAETPDSGSECIIGGTIYAGGTPNPTNACQTCQPASSTTAWTNSADGTCCGTGMVCSAGSCGSSGQPCCAGEVMCGGACVDTQNDPNNCGACGSACPVPTSPSTVACALGRCLVTLVPGAVAGDLAVDFTSLYWTDGSTVSKVPIAGGPVTTLAFGQSRSYGIAIDANSVYWTNYVSPGGTVMKCPLAGGSPTTLAAAEGQPAGITVDGARVYWADYGSGAIVSTPLGGGALTTIVLDPGGPDSIAVDGTSVYWDDTGDAGMGVADNTALMKAPLSGGGTVTTLASVAGPATMGGVDLLALDSTDVYWSSRAFGGFGGVFGGVLRIPLSGGTTTTLASNAAPLGIAIDSARVYWSNSTTVMTVPLGGGVATTLASFPSSFPWSVTVDATSLYFATYGFNGGSSAIMKVTK